MTLRQSKRKKLLRVSVIIFFVIQAQDRFNDKCRNYSPKTPCFSCFFFFFIAIIQKRYGKNFKISTAVFISLSTAFPDKSDVFDGISQTNSTLSDRVRLPTSAEQQAFRTEKPQTPSPPCGTLWQVRVLKSFGSPLRVCSTKPSSLAISSCKGIV